MSSELERSSDVRIPEDATLGGLLDRVADELRHGGEPTCPWYRDGRLRESQVKPGWAWCPACGAALDCGDG